MRLATERAGLDFEEGRWLLVALRGGAHIRLGYGSFAEYTERIFGYSPRLTQEKLRVAEALEELPETARELRTGKVSFSAVRELTRVATPATEREWLSAAEGRTVREVEKLVSGHRPGSKPDDLPDSSSKRHVIRLEVSGDAHLGAAGVNSVGMNSVGMNSAGMKPVGDAHVSQDKAPNSVRHVGPHVGAGGQPVRATQSIPPALRRSVRHRDSGLCVVVRHADGTPYGRSPSPLAADARTKAFLALVGLGYRESEAKRALADTQLGSEASVELIVRKALQLLARA